MHHSGKSGQEPGGRSWCRNRGRVLFIGLILMSYSVCLLKTARATNTGMAPPAVSWDLLCQSLIKKIHHRFAHRTIWWGHFPQLKLPFPKGLKLVSSCHKTSHHTIPFNFQDHAEQVQSNVHWSWEMSPRVANIWRLGSPVGCSVWGHLGGAGLLKDICHWLRRFKSPAFLKIALLVSSLWFKCESSASCFCLLALPNYYDYGL